jgi:hypothetical protein
VRVAASESIEDRPSSWIGYSVKDVGCCCSARHFLIGNVSVTYFSGRNRPRQGFEFSLDFDCLRHEAASRESFWLSGGSARFRRAPDDSAQRTKCLVNRGGILKDLGDIRVKDNQIGLVAAAIRVWISASLVIVLGVNLSLASWASLL